MTPNTVLEHDGVAQSVTEWALDYGITPAIIVGRLERGMSVAEAIVRPMLAIKGQRLPIFSRLQQDFDPKSNKVLLSHKGKRRTVREWAQIVGIDTFTLKSRLAVGWSIERALTSPVRKMKAASAKGHPGVPSDFAPIEGTGAGSTAQETPNITFSGKVENA